MLRAVPSMLRAVPSINTADTSKQDKGMRAVESESYNEAKGDGGRQMALRRVASYTVATGASPDGAPS